MNLVKSVTSWEQIKAPNWFLWLIVQLYEKWKATVGKMKKYKKWKISCTWKQVLTRFWKQPSCIALRVECAILSPLPLQFYISSSHVGSISRADVTNKPEHSARNKSLSYPAFHLILAFTISLGEMFRKKCLILKYYTLTCVLTRKYLIL